MSFWSSAASLALASTADVVNSAVSTTSAIHHCRIGWPELLIIVVLISLVGCGCFCCGCWQGLLIGHTFGGPPAQKLAGKAAAFVGKSVSKVAQERLAEYHLD